jgi:hypothetical protein
VDADLLRAVYLTRAQARRIRKSVQKRRHRTDKVIARATLLLGRFDRLERRAARRPKSGDKRQQKLQASAREESLNDLEKSLGDLESVKMTRADDATLRTLKADIRKVIKEHSAWK